MGKLPAVFQEGRAGPRLRQRVARQGRPHPGATDPSRALDRAGQGGGALAVDQPAAGHRRLRRQLRRHIGRPGIEAQHLRRNPRRLRCGHAAGSRTEWRTGTPAVVAKNHEKIYNKLLATDPAKAKKFLDSVTKKDSVKEAADPGETKVVNKAVKTKKAAVAAERLVKIAKSKVNKINMDPKLDHDVKQSSRY